MYIHSEVIKICNLNEEKRKNELRFVKFIYKKKNKPLLNYKDCSRENIYLIKCICKEIDIFFFYYYCWKVMIVLSIVLTIIFSRYKMQMVYHIII